MQPYPIPKRHLQRVLVSVWINHLHALHRQSICWRLLKLTQQRGEFNCPQRAYSCFPTPFRTKALHAGILVCLKDRFNACVSNAFGEIFHVHISPIEQVRLEGSDFPNPREVGHE
jgi:hypothetical protein